MQHSIMMLRASYRHDYLFSLLRLANPFCFSISFLLVLFQPPAPLFLASPRLSSPPPCAPPSHCKHPVSISRALVPWSPSHVPSIRAALSHPRLLVAFRGVEDSAIIWCLLPPSNQTQTWQRAVLVLRVTGVPSTSVAAGGCHCKGCAATARGTRGSQLPKLTLSR